MERDSGRALVNLQRRLERQFFEGSRLDAATKHWVVQVYQSVADVVGDSVAVTAAFDVISALNIDLQELRDSTMAPLAARAAKRRAQRCSGDESDDVSASSSEGEADQESLAAPLWLDNLLPLPRSCSVIPAVLPLPQSMNSRVLTASPGAECNAVLGYVLVPYSRSSLPKTAAAHLLFQCNEATGYSLHLICQNSAIGIPLELNFTVASHCPAVFSGDLLLVTDAWLVPSPSATRGHSYLEVARCHTIISVSHTQPTALPPASPSNLSYCRGSVDAITAASAASGRPSALVRICDATIGAISKERADHPAPLVFVVIEHETALSSLSWARCSSEIHLNDLKPKNVAGLGKVFYSTPATRCTLPTIAAAPSSCISSLAALYKATVTGCICSGVYVVNGRSLLLFPGVCLRGHGRGLRTGNTIVISGLYSAGACDDICQVLAVNAAVDYVVVRSAPVSAASTAWQQFRGLGLFPWSTLASCLHPYAYLTLRSLVRSILHLLSASVSDIDVVCEHGPAHQIMIALGWCHAQMPVLDGLQTRFFEASQGQVASGCFAPMAVSLQFASSCGTARAESLSQEAANQGSCSDVYQYRAPSFPIQELCLSREPSMLEHMTSNTVSALEAAGHEQTISGFVLDWFNRGAQRRSVDYNLWLVGTVEFDDDSNSLVLTDSTHSMPLWLLPSVAAPVGSSIMVTHGEILLSASDDVCICAVLRALQLKFTVPRPCSAPKITVMVKFITPGVLYAAIPNSWLDCVVVRSEGAIEADKSHMPVVGDAVMVWLDKDAKEMLSYARVGSVFSLSPSGCEKVHFTETAIFSTFKLELHSPLLLQLVGWMPICLSSFALNWDDLKMVKATQQSTGGVPETLPDISLGSLQTVCRLPNPFVRSFFSVQNLPSDYTLVSCMCVVKRMFQNWDEHEQVLECRELSEDELKAAQHMLLDYTLDSIVSPSSSGQCTTVTIKLDRLAVPQLITPGCAVVLYRFWHRRNQNRVLIKCSPVSRIELLLPADWLPVSEASGQSCAVGSIPRAHVHLSQSHHITSLMLESQADLVSDVDLNRWQRRELLGSIDRSSCSWQLRPQSDQPLHLMHIRRNRFAAADVVTDVVANVVSVKSVSACFQCSVCSCVAVAGHAYLPSDKVSTVTTVERQKADQNSLVKTREMRCSRCRLSRTALFTAKCVVQLDDGTDSAIAHIASLALFQALLRISPVALERMADLVSCEGAMQLLCGNKRWGRQQDAKRVCAASKVLTEICLSQKVYRRVSVTASVLLSPSSSVATSLPQDPPQNNSMAGLAAHAEDSILRLQVLGLEDVDVCVRGHRLLSQLDQQLQAW